MPVEDPKALAQTYLAKHNIEKIFEVSSRTAPPRRCRSDTCVCVCARFCVCICACLRWDPIRTCKPMCSSIGQRMCAST